MNKKIVLALGFLPFPLFAFPADPADPSCPLPTRAPCGVEEVISCALLNYNKTAKTPLANNKAFYDTQLFDAGNQDGFCEYKTESGTYPPGVIAGNLTGTYYDQFCSSQTGSYFSYGNFIKAANAINKITTQSAFGGSGGFACSTTGSTVAINTAQSVQEVVNFFASEAQETTSALKGYTTDGLYYRYENSALKQAIGGAECREVATCFTAYYPPTTPSANWVGINTGTYNTTDPNQNLTYTPYLWLLSYQQPTSSAYYLQYNIVDSPMTVLTPTPAINLQPNQIQKVSSNDYSTVKNINDSGILYAGMYVGMGSLQLTGSSMYFYYGWYENNLAFNAPALLANFDQFVGDPLGRITDPTNMTGFLRDGVIAFEGAFWYWMYRSIGRDFDVTGLMYPSLHQLAVDVARPACHCVGAVTLMINGGCNDFNKRAAYANYFAGSNVLNLDTSQTQCIQTVTLKGKSVTINGAKCTFKDGTTTLDEATQNLLAYCQNP